MRKKRKRQTCFVCGTTYAIQKHHVIPRCIGGDRIPNNTIPLCKNCHNKVHFLLDPVIHYLANAVLFLQSQLDKQGKKVEFKIPVVGFRFKKNGGKGDEDKEKGFN